STRRSGSQDRRAARDSGTERAGAGGHIATCERDALDRPRRGLLEGEAGKVQLTRRYERRRPSMDVIRDPPDRVLRRGPLTGRGVDVSVDEPRDRAEAVGVDDDIRRRVVARERGDGTVVDHDGAVADGCGVGWPGDEGADVVYQGD